MNPEAATVYDAIATYGSDVVTARVPEHLTVRGETYTVGIQPTGRPFDGAMNYGFIPAGVGGIEIGRLSDNVVGVDPSMGVSAAGGWTFQVSKGGASKKRRSTKNKTRKLKKGGAEVPSLQDLFTQVLEMRTYRPEYKMRLMLKEAAKSLVLLKQVLKEPKPC
jgi:hypothetical protein